jgi:hypothetical protein
VNPIGAGRRAVSGGREARLDETQNDRHRGGYIAPAFRGIESECGRGRPLQAESSSSVQKSMKASSRPLTIGISRSSRSSA